VEGRPCGSWQNVRLDIYLDKSMVEVYANGRRAITSRVYRGSGQNAWS
jgi:sucrose-6-phosphate hydrolase SacC (GH32 family)